jgi:hypothetical protein
MYIQEIYFKADDGAANPGPGNYSPKCSLGTDSPKYSFKHRCSMVQRKISPIGLKFILEALDKSKKLPGPATYKQPDFIGPIKPTIVPSRIYTPQCSSIPRADTRFKLPSKKVI